MRRKDDVFDGLTAIKQYFASLCSITSHLLSQLVYAYQIRSTQFDASISSFFFSLLHTYLFLSDEFRCVNNNRVSTTKTIRSKILSSIEKEEEGEEKKKRKETQTHLLLPDWWVILSLRILIGQLGVFFLSLAFLLLMMIYYLVHNFFLSITYTSDFFSAFSLPPSHFSHSTAKMTTTQQIKFQTYKQASKRKERERYSIQPVLLLAQYHRIRR